MFNFALRYPVFIVAVLFLTLSLVTVNADTAPRAESPSRLHHKGPHHHSNYGRTVYSDANGHDAMITDDDDDDVDDDDNVMSEDEQYDDDNDDLDLSLKDSNSSVQHSRGVKADAVLRGNLGGLKKKSLGGVGGDHADGGEEEEEEYDASEEDEDLAEEDTMASSRSSVHHALRGSKKDEILRGNEDVPKKQPLNTKDEDEDTDEEGSSDDTEGSSSGDGSGIGGLKHQSSLARKHDLDTEQLNDEESKEDWNDESDEEDEDSEDEHANTGKNPVGTHAISEPYNATNMTEKASKKSNETEQAAKNVGDSDDGDDSSGEESGSTGDFVQGSGEVEEHVKGVQPISEPRPKNGTGVSKDGKGENVQTAKVQVKSVKKNITEKKINSNLRVNASSRANETKTPVNDHGAKAIQHKITLPHENRAEKKELHSKKEEHISNLHKAEKKVATKTVSKLKSPAKKEPVKVSKGSLNASNKELHSKHVAAHVKHVVKSHSKVSHAKLLRKATSPKPQSCHSENIMAGHSLKGGTRAGEFEILGETASMHACLQRCCSKHTCDVALLIDGRCYGVACYSKELCLAVPVPHPHFVFSQLAYINKGQKRGDIEVHQEFLCKYGNLTLKNNEQWSGELCGGVVRCKDGITSVKKCPGIPPKPDNCAKPRLIVKHQPGKCCKMRWRCKANHCVFNNRLIKHGSKLSDPLCTGVVSCYNGHLKMDYCPKIPKKPKDCARPKLKMINVPGKCCKKHWVCSDKSCTYDGIKISHGEKLTDASCAVVMQCRNGFLDNKQCPSPPPVPHACINPSLHVKRVPGECCEMSWTCAIS